MAKYALFLHIKWEKREIHTLWKPRQWRERNIEMDLDETEWWANNRLSPKKSTTDKLFSQIPSNETNVLTKCQVPHSSIKIFTKQQAKYVHAVFQTYGIWIFHE